MDSVDTLGGLVPVTSSLEEKQRAAVMKVAFKTVGHFFGGFSPSVLRSHRPQRATQVHLSARLTSLGRVDDVSLPTPCA
jgi:hypothetical protein